jgi:hypothetical protein
VTAGIGGTADLTFVRGKRERIKVSSYYAAISALIFAVVALVHLLRILKQWTVQIGSLSVSMSVSWLGLVIAALLSIWGFMQLG